MRYLCLVYGDEATLDAMPQHEIDALIDEVLANNEELQASGQLILAEALDHVAAATTVRVRNGRLSATDGPFAETNEQLGGFVLIEARDLNEATQIAVRIPSARIGSIEVRPVIDLLHGCRVDARRAGVGSGADRCHPRARRARRLPPGARCTSRPPPTAGANGRRAPPTSVPSN